MLAEACHELTDSEIWKEVAVQEGMKAYKLSKDYKNQNVAFLVLAFIKGMNNARKKVTKHFLDLNLSFLDNEEQDEGEQSLGPKELRVSLR